MDEKLRETTNLGREVMNSKRQIMRKLGHVVQIRICVDVNVMLNLSINYNAGLEVLLNTMEGSTLLKFNFLSVSYLQ